MDQQTGSKSGKEYVKAAYCHPAYLTYMPNTSCKMLGWDEAQARIKTAGRNINNLRYADDTTLMAESEEELKSLLMKVKEEKYQGIWSHHFMGNRWVNSGNSVRLYFFGLQNHCRW